MSWPVFKFHGSFQSSVMHISTNQKCLSQPEFAPTNIDLDQISALMSVMVSWPTLQFLYCFRSSVMQISSTRIVFFLVPICSREFLNHNNDLMSIKMSWPILQFRGSFQSSVMHQSQTRIVYPSPDSIPRIIFLIKLMIL